MKSRLQPAKRNPIRSAKKRTKHSLKASSAENRTSHLRQAVRFDDMED
ncbi:MAG: hypothetical protein AAFN10_25245 [Bacteroidota bacterium]